MRLSGSKSTSGNIKIYANDSGFLTNKGFKLSALFGLKGVPLKVDKLKCMGTPDEVCAEIKKISKNMKKPMVMQVDNNIAVFDLYVSDDLEFNSGKTKNLTKGLI